MPTYLGIAGELSVKKGLVNPSYIDGHLWHEGFKSVQQVELGDNCTFSNFGDQNQGGTKSCNLTL